MKIFGLVFVLMLIHCCTAATNRSTVWIIANNQIYSTGNGYQFCTTNPGATATSVTFLTTSKLTVSGKIVGIASDSTANFITNSAMVSQLSIIFYYNSSHYITLALFSPGSALSVSSLLSGTAVDSTATTGNFIYSTPSTFPISVVSGNRILSPIGTAWLDFSVIREPYTASAPLVTSSILITDYISSSVVAINQFSDPTAAAAGGGALAIVTNSFFQFAVRTPTSSISASNILSSSGCTTSGRKRSLDHLIQKRFLSCPTSGLDASMTSSTVATMCTNANSMYAAATVASSKTATNLQDAVARGVNIVNSLYTADVGYFSAANSKFSSGAVFGTALAIASILLAHLY